MFKFQRESVMKARRRRRDKASGICITPIVNRDNKPYSITLEGGKLKDGTYTEYDNVMLDIFFEKDSKSLADLNALDNDLFAMALKHKSRVFGDAFKDHTEVTYELAYRPLVMIDKEDDSFHVLNAKFPIDPNTNAVNPTKGRYFCNITREGESEENDPYLIQDHDEVMTLRLEVQGLYSDMINNRWGPYCRIRYIRTRPGKKESPQPGVEPGSSA